MTDTESIPELSVVIAAFNAGGTLGEQLRELAAQTPQWPWEVIVADNGSTDRTTEVVAELQADFPWLRLVDASQRRGPAAARNVGVTYARAARIAFCDADDLIADGWVETMHAALVEHEFVAGSFDTRRLAGRNRFVVSWSPQREALSVKPYLPEFVTGGSGNLGIRRSVFNEAGGFDESAMVAEDDDLCLRVQLAGHQLVFESSLVLHVRRRAGLRAVLRQARAYGAGARRLEHRYARIVARLHPAVPAPEVTPTGVANPGGNSGGLIRDRLRSLMRVVRRLGQPEQLADLTWRVGYRWGWRQAKLDDVVQLHPDDFRWSRSRIR